MIGRNQGLVKPTAEIAAGIVLVYLSLLDTTDCSDRGLAGLVVYDAGHHRNRQNSRILVEKEKEEKKEEQGKEAKSNRQ